MITFETLRERLRPPRRPLVVAYGLGVDSTAAVIELARRYRQGATWCRPDLLLFADTGDEKKRTYRYEAVFQAYLRAVGFPELLTVRYQPVRASYRTLEENCLTNATLPSLAFGYKKCSLKWKVGPQNKFVKGWRPAQLCWAAGLKVIKLIGYDAGPKDMRRCTIEEDAGYEYWYPLRELGWDRERCLAEIRAEGLPGWETDLGGEWLETGGVPVKSACFYCPATQPQELVQLALDEPDAIRRIVRMEEVAAPNLKTVEGLWRTSTRKRTGSMTEFIIREGLLPTPVEEVTHAPAL